MSEISAELFRLPIEIPEPTRLQTRFSTRAWWDGDFIDTHSSRFVTWHGYLLSSLGPMKSLTSLSWI
jgi:hypothetical protein